MKKRMEREPEAVMSRHDVIARHGGFVLVYGTFEDGLVRSMTRSDRDRAMAVLKMTTKVSGEMMARPGTTNPSYAIIPIKYHQGHNDLGEVHP